MSWAHGVGLRLLWPSWSHARLILKPGAPFLLQFLLYLVNFFCQEVVVLILVRRQKNKKQKQRGGYFKNDFISVARIAAQRASKIFKKDEGGIA